MGLEERLIVKGMQELSAVIGMFQILFWMVVIWVYPGDKNFQALHLMYLFFVVHMTIKFIRKESSKCSRRNLFQRINLDKISFVLIYINGKFTQLRGSILEINQWKQCRKRSREKESEGKRKVQTSDSLSAAPRPAAVPAGNLPNLGPTPHLSQQNTQGEDRLNKPFWGL